LWVNWDFQLNINKTIKIKDVFVGRNCPHCVKTTKSINCTMILDDTFIDLPTLEVYGDIYD